ncbi:hypothetical protein OG333_38625 (plasmid) [Streptomyces anulatus]|uniref:hypothetical protein n=1 Tax=Streptomyces anulatus TaxID=1892 RepID=UPI00386854A5|nr:hypothetical protein OG333_38625 [Streptomyces anulatus]
MPLKKPELPPGPMTDLNNALHALHRKAGEPSLPRMSALWREGYPDTYATDRSKSGVAAMFSRPDLPNGEALMDLVALLMTNFMGADEMAVKRQQERFRGLRENAASHRDTHPASDLVAVFQEMAARYTKLAETVQYAELIAVSSHVPQRRREAFEFATKHATSLLGAEDPVMQRLMERADQVSAQDWTP